MQIILSHIGFLNKCGVTTPSHQESDMKGAQGRSSHSHVVPSSRSISHPVWQMMQNKSKRERYPSGCKLVVALLTFVLFLLPMALPAGHNYP